MSLLFKPHTLTVQPATQAINADKSVNSADYDTAGTGTVEGQVTPKSHAVMFEKFGLELKKPHLLLCDLADVAKVTVGSRLTMDGRTFEVAGPARHHNALAIGSHLSVALEELDFERTEV